MMTNETDLTLRDLIHQAISTAHPKNHFRFGERKNEEEKLLWEIEEKNRKAERGEAGVIDLDLTLRDLLNNSEAFLQDINDFIAGRNNGKYQYTRRFEVLLDYINNTWNAELSTAFLKKFLYKDDDRRILEILKWLHGHNKSSKKSMAEIAEEFGVDVKTIRHDFARLESSFEFLDAVVKIDSIDATYISPVHPVFLALNSAQLYALFYALRILSKNTVMEEFAEEISTAVYSQLSDFGRDLVPDLYPSDEFPKDFHNQHMDSHYYYMMGNRQTVFRAAAYKQPCTIIYWNGREKKTVTGIPQIAGAPSHRVYLVETDGGEAISIDVDQIVSAEGKRRF